MIVIPGGTFDMGSDGFYPEETPVRRVRVDPFRIDPTPVTNRQFSAFVAATGYVTFAEIPPDPKHYAGLLPELAQPGSAVFDAPRVAPRDLSVPSWWSYRIGASWRAPRGPGSSIEGLEDHPVVHIVYADAEAYAAWAGKALPTEAEWEFAARGGLADAAYAWGDELAPGGAMMANYWQGAFPVDSASNGDRVRTSAVGSYPANGYGLYDMIGNVWEWTSDWFAQPKIERKSYGSCCVPANPSGGTRGGSIIKRDPARVPRKVLKGGSHLCAENYCQRYRPAARYANPVDTSTGHIGFRCIIRDV
ncbi:formylglycine-generating enzyme family protein [Sphingobium sp. AN641]|uniref:formylglycine-generating enzyme family protein n=1 Tax=Sphingobium sp. AN641 TaxID=3133443 RepID=UPI0030C00CDE